MSDGRPIEGVVVVHFDEEGDQSYHVFGDERVRLFIVDDRAPNDRVFEYLSRDDASVFRDLIPEGSPIGSNADERHAAIEGVVLAMADGKRHLALAPAAPEE